MELDKRLAIIPIAVVIVAAFLFIRAESGPVPTGVPYIYRDGSVIFTNITEECRVSGGICKISDGPITYWSGEYDTTFFPRGFYHGARTGTFYSKSNEKKMEITQNLNPSDRIIQGGAVFFMNDGKMAAKFYLDEDWRRNAVKTWLIWGKDWENSKEFVFSKVVDGVYSDVVEDSDTGRFRKDYHLSDGNFAVTDALPEDFRKGMMQGKTAIIYS